MAWAWVGGRWGRSWKTGRRTDRRREVNGGQSKQKRQTRDGPTSHKQAGRQTWIGVIRRQSTACISECDYPRVGNITKGWRSCDSAEPCKRALSQLFKGVLCEHSAELSQLDSTTTTVVITSHQVGSLHLEGSEGRLRNTRRPKLPPLLLSFIRSFTCNTNRCNTS